MFDFICVGAPSNLNGEVVKVWNLSMIFLFSRVRLAILQINSILVIIMLSGWISPNIRPENRIPEKQAG